MAVGNYFDALYFFACLCMAGRVQEIPNEVKNFFNNYRNEEPHIIRKKYIELALRYHPNRHPNQKETMTKIFQALGRAQNAIHNSRGKKGLPEAFSYMSVYRNARGDIIAKNEKERRERRNDHPGFHYRKVRDENGVTEIWTERQPVQSRPVHKNLSPRGSSTKQKSAVHNLMSIRFGVSFN